MRIADNGKGLAFEFANYWAREDEGSVLIGVLRGDDGDFVVTVEYATADGTAATGEDYTATAGKLEYAAGEKLKLLTIPILNDGLKEPNETFRLYLTNATGGAVLGTPRIATITILDNDPGVQFTQNQLCVYENEGAAVVTVTRGNDCLLDAFTVDYATTNGTATAGTDYTEMKGTLAFAAGEMSRSFAVPILDDGVPKQDRRFKAVLSNPTGGMALGTVANVTTTVTVCDNREMLPHRFEALRVSPDGTVSLTLGGGYSSGLGLVNRFQPYYDLYPIEVSTDLVRWTHLITLHRTNATTNVPAYLDEGARNFDRRFYRTPTNYLVSPFLHPTGPFAVGRVSRLLTDPTRRNRYGISTNGSFMITIWYPGLAEPGKLPELWDDPIVAIDPIPQGPYLDRDRFFRGYALSNLKTLRTRPPTR